MFSILYVNNGLTFLIIDIYKKHLNLINTYCKVIEDTINNVVGKWWLDDKFVDCKVI